MTVASGGEYRGILDCIRCTWTHGGGIRGFYSGFVPNLVGIIPFQGTYFGFFFFLTGKYEENHNGCKPDAHTQLLYSAMVSTVSVWVSYPFNLVRTKLQMQGVNGRPNLYKGMADCFRVTHLHEGWRGFYRGLLPNYFKALPSLSISLVLVKKFNDMLHRALC
jgi:solute carrier family 25 phosphate transporter 23/24/25/41